MTVGEGIFWGAIVIAIVGLYATTKDRWRWKRIAKWGIGLPLVLLVLGGAGVWAYQNYGSRPQPLDVFGGVALASTPADVRFAKGEPSEVVEDGLWYYNAGSGSARPDSAGYVVRFKNGRVRLVGYVATPEQIVTPSLQGFTIGAAYDSVIEKLGPPDHTSASADGLKRMISYSKLQTFYALEKGEVKDLGIYDPASGPMEYGKAASAPASAPSAAQPQGGPVPKVEPTLDHCAPGLSKAERMKRLAQHGTIRETGTGRYEAGARSLAFHFDGALMSCF